MVQLSVALNHRKYGYIDLKFTNIRLEEISTTYASVAAVWVGRIVDLSDLFSLKLLLYCACVQVADMRSDKKFFIGRLRLAHNPLSCWRLIWHVSAAGTQWHYLSD